MSRIEVDSPCGVAPFLKWAGGKRWLVNSAAHIAPTSFNRYIEPFLGGGAVFFALEPKDALLADLNAELINAYTAIKSHWRLVEQSLKRHSRLHCDEYYYKVRSSVPRKPHTRAGKFIYLNRTCWNGLYRVNSRGDFNVPRGTKNSVILDTDNFSVISDRLSKCKLHCQDFELTLKTARKDDFVFIDPPYTVNHNLNGFRRYNETIFSWEDQLRLKSAITCAVRRGVQITMTNADHPSIHQLYRDLSEGQRLGRSSVIAGGAKHRGATSELLMRFGWTAD